MKEKTHKEKSNKELKARVSREIISAHANGWGLGARRARADARRMGGGMRARVKF